MGTNVLVFFPILKIIQSNYGGIGINHRLSDHKKNYGSKFQNFFMILNDKNCVKTEKHQKV